MYLSYKLCLILQLGPCVFVMDIAIIISFDIIIIIGIESFELLGIKIFSECYHLWNCVKSRQAELLFYGIVFQAKS